MRKSSVVKAIERLGFGKLIIENGDQGPKQIALSCEDYVVIDGEDVMAGDYYGEFRDGYPWIHPKLEKLAAKADACWEWENPAVISLYL